MIVPDLDDPATQDVLRLFRGEATVADARRSIPRTDPSADEASDVRRSHDATTTTVATRPTAPAPPPPSGRRVLIEDNGVGIFPPDDPTCR